MPVVGIDAEPEFPAYEPGSRDDFDRLYRDSYPRIYRTLLAVLADPAAAEDCTQDAFVLAFRAWARWRPDAPAEAWLHRIAINAAVSYQRKANLRSIGSGLRRLGRPAVRPHPPHAAADAASRDGPLQPDAGPIPLAGCPEARNRGRRRAGASVSSRVGCLGQPQPTCLAAAGRHDDRRAHPKRSAEPHARGPEVPGRATRGAGTPRAIGNSRAQSRVSGTFERNWSRTVGVTT